MSSAHYTPPVNPLPPVVVALVLFIMGIELAFMAGSRGLIGGLAAVGWRSAAIESYSFYTSQFDWMLQTGEWRLEYLKRLVTYPFVNYTFTRALFVCVFVLALGKLVAEVFGSLPMLLVFVLSGVGGALIFGLLLGSGAQLVGGFPCVYGLIGAFTWLLWRKLSLVGENQARAFQLIAVLMGIQFLFRLLFGGAPDWVADLGGFATGFGLSFLLAPGGWARIVSRIRRE
ncbi:rhomboid family intramembrane serine protease [Ruegeria sp.]|uniref:rhomboid family intramembrane serine protease n=1 Tax=Ruegeria sp. TaxID=1879320 RepID=UPI002317AC92|nr:rhomboid family intramembrane serine protease [Ruegeria sp.]MDA7964080.1 rhomboid family intramembrane serine protease [Ruegeria sp.]